MLPKEKYTYAFSEIVSRVRAAALLQVLGQERSYAIAREGGDAIAVMKDSAWSTLTHARYYIQDTFPVEGGAFALALILTNYMAREERAKRGGLSTVISVPTHE